jgi:SAM-dependent methyltransferase
VGRSSRRGSLTYYRDDLALVHHLGFGSHADATAPGVLALLEPVRGGLVLELGCGSGLLTRHLVEAGHRVVATDASPAMLALARETAPGAEVRQLLLPDDLLPECDAVVSVGHVLSYLPDEAAVDRALAAAGDALRPGGVLALDLCDLRYGELRRDEPSSSRIAEDWAIVMRFSLPRRSLFVREIAAFLRNEDRTWRRDDERHENVLVDTALAPALLAEHGVQARVAESFGDEVLPDGLVAIVGRKVDG